MSGKKKINETSLETQNFLDDLEKQRITMTVIDKDGVNDPFFEDDEEKEFSPILQFIAKIIYKLMLYIGVLLTIVGFVNIYGAYMMYEVYKVGGVMGVIYSKWFFFLIGYVVFMFVYKKVHSMLYKYSEGI